MRANADCSDSRPLSWRMELDQSAPEDLAGGRLRKIVDELNHARPLVRRQGLCSEIDEFVRTHVAPWCQHDISASDLALDWVGQRTGGDHRHRWMRGHHSLDFGRIDV